MDTKTYRRKLPQGLSSFAKLRELKCLYVDKTEIIWNLLNCDSYINYLSRPRRFGKTMLVDTLQCYFEGRKELFEGLKINNYEKEWKQYPVIRLDMSNAGASAESLKSFFDREFQYLESKYDITIKETDSLTVRFNSIIKKAYQDTKNRVVILIDEYDCPLQHSWHTPEHEKCTAIYRDVFAVLKSADAYERFVFITGITKFTQISLFSVLNNLNNISFLPNYAEICGISKQELLDNFQPEIQLLANKFKCSYDNAVLKLKENYDGYHFSDENMTDMFNPFSLINALANQKISNYWIASGATSMIYKFVTDLDINIDKYDNYLIERDTLESSDVSCGDNGLFLYQTGYLTIKSFDDDVFILGFPNKEVRKALYKFVLPSLTMRAQNIVSSEQTNLIYNLKQANIPEIFNTLKALCADVPYSNKKLTSIDMEERYRFIISTICYASGFKVQVERMMNTGRIDIVIFETHHIYVLELKLSKNGGLVSAIKQMKERDYTAPFKADGREVIGIAFELDDEGKGLLKYQRI